jgi:uncharacterized protein (UPF0248 family)
MCGQEAHKIRHMPRARGPKPIEVPVVPEQAKKVPLRTSIDVFNRILWDEDFNENEFIIGYMDRFDGMMETPLTVFAALNGEIPFHRVHYFKNGAGVKVWDRDTRSDMIFRREGQ